MTKEQEEAIEYFENKIKDVKPEYIETYVDGKLIRSETISLKMRFDKEDADKMGTVLNMLKEKDKEIERLRYIKKSFDYVVQKETEKKNRQIDLMAEEINETDRGHTDYCEMKIECDRNCKDCIKRYYERKSEE